MYGCWGDDCGTIYAGPFGGIPRKTMKAESMEAVFMPNPKDVKIAELQARVLELEQRIRP